MKLHLVERLSLLSIMPDKGNFVTLLNVDKARKALALTDQERIDMKVELYNDGKSMRWDVEKDKGVDIDLPSQVVELVKEKILELDKANALEERHVSLYRKFVIGEG